MQIAANHIGLPNELTLPWELAPAALKEAWEAGREAVLNKGDQDIKVQDADINASAVRMAYDAEAVANRRAGKPIPDDVKVRTAVYDLTIAKEDLLAAETRTRQTEAELGDVLEDETLRKEWLEAMREQLEKDKKALAKIAPQALTLANSIRQLEAYSYLVGTYPHSGFLEFDNTNSMAQAIDAAMNTRLWSPPTPAAEATFQN